MGNVQRKFLGIRDGFVNQEFDNFANAINGINSSYVAGTQTNDNAATGKIGETLSASTLRASAAALTTITALNVTSRSITAGDWDVWAHGGFLISSGTPNSTSLNLAISTTSATFPAISTTAVADSTGQITVFRGNTFSSATAGDEILFCQSRVSLASTTTYYLVAQATFGAGGISAYGSIVARRRR